MNAIYFCGWSLYRGYFTLFHRLRVCNVERVPIEGPVLLASNHASFLDPPLVGAALPRDLCYLARESLFSNPFSAWVLRKVNCIPVDRDGGGAAGLKGILDRLKAGKAVILFPEGTRTTDGKLQRVRSGVGLAVLKARAPVVPVRVFGTYEALRRGMSFPRPVRVTVKFGQPLAFTELRAEASSCSKDRLKEIYREVSEQIMASIGSLQPCVDKSEFP